MMSIFVGMWSGDDATELIRASVGEIGPALLDEARHSCATHAVDWLLFSSIMIVQYLRGVVTDQRDDHVGRVASEAVAHGIEPYEAPAPICDEQDVRRLATKLVGLSVPRLPGSDSRPSWVDAPALAELVATRYYPARYFAQLVAKVATEVDVNPWLVPAS